MAKPPMPFYGGKQLLAERIIALLPEHQHYIEPYAGSLAVLLAKPRAPHETVNDLDANLMHFWQTLRSHPDQLETACGLTPHARAEHRAAMDAVGDPSDDPIERARRTWVMLTQGQSAGTQRRTGWRYTASPALGMSMPRYLQAYVDRLGPAVGRLHGVSLECRPAVDVVADYGRHRDALLYVDPPYVTSTRQGNSYAHNMTDDDHRVLAKALHECKAAVVLSGYASDMYDLELYSDWHRYVLPAWTGNGGAVSDRTEVLWSNRPLNIAAQADLFDLAGGSA
jgi:DNA adenine methylase